MTKETGGQAFPWCGDLNDCPTINLGMTLRDYFAAKAMQGMLAAAENYQTTELCDYAYQVADAMIAERGKA